MSDQDMSKIDIISFVFDMLIILSPFTLFFSNPLTVFTTLFYVIYLPNLFFNIYKYRCKKRNIEALESQFKKIISEDFFIEN